MGSLVEDVGVVGWGRWGRWLGTLGSLVGSLELGDIGVVGWGYWGCWLGILGSLVGAFGVIGWVCGVGAIGMALGHGVGPWVCRLGPWGPWDPLGPWDPWMGPWVGPWGLWGPWGPRGPWGGPTRGWGRRRAVGERRPRRRRARWACCSTWALRTSRWRSAVPPSAMAASTSSASPAAAATPLSRWTAAPCTRDTPQVPEGVRVGRADVGHLWGTRGVARASIGHLKGG